MDAKTAAKNRQNVLKQLKIKDKPQPGEMQAKLNRLMEKRTKPVIAVKGLI